MLWGGGHSESVFPLCHNSPTASQERTSKKRNTAPITLIMACGSTGTRSRRSRTRKLHERRKQRKKERGAETMVWSVCVCVLVCVCVCVCSCITVVLDDRGELINPVEPDLQLISISVCRCQHACNTQRAHVHIMRACTYYVELQVYRVNGIRCIMSKRVIA